VTSNPFKHTHHQRDFTIEKQLPRFIMKKKANVFHTPLPFFATQITITFLNSRISANNDKVEGLSANREICIKVIVSLLQNLFSHHHQSKIDILRICKHFFGRQFLNSQSSLNINYKFKVKQKGFT
jgi:hypothetical protein